MGSLACPEAAPLIVTRVGVQARKYASQKGSRLFVHIRLSAQCSSKSRAAVAKEMLKQCHLLTPGWFVQLHMLAIRNPIVALCHQLTMLQIFGSAALVQLHMLARNLKPCRVGKEWVDCKR